VLELVCVRHGRTAWNADLRFQGQSDVPLDAQGRAQAMLLAMQLRETSLDAAVSSDLERSAETARIILGEHPSVALRLDADLREMAFGEWEGLTWAQIVRADPKLAADGWTRPKNYTPPSGERFEEVVGRARRALSRIQVQQPQGRVLVVTHAGVLHALLRVILGEEEASALEVRFNPGSITRFAVDDSACGRLLVLNEGAETAGPSPLGR
jgi:alpha-ribazole phosphatase